MSTFQIDHENDIVTKEISRTNSTHLANVRCVFGADAHETTTYLGQFLEHYFHGSFVVREKDIQFSDAMKDYGKVVSAGLNRFYVKLEKDIDGDTKETLLQELQKRGVVAAYEFNSSVWYAVRLFEPITANQKSFRSFAVALDEPVRDVFAKNNQRRYEEQQAQKVIQEQKDREAYAKYLQSLAVMKPGDSLRLKTVGFLGMPGEGIPVGFVEYRPEHKTILHYGPKKTDSKRFGLYIRPASSFYIPQVPDVLTPAQVRATKNYAKKLSLGQVKFS